MASTATSARLQYLMEASQTLLISSPVLSAHLQSTRLALGEEEGSPATTRDGTLNCTACGNTLIPGWSCKLQTNDRKEARPRNTRRQSSAGAAKKLKVACSLCGTVGTIQSPKPPKGSRKRAMKTPNVNIDRARKPEPESFLEPTTVPIPIIVPKADQNNVGSTTTGRKARGKKSSLHSLLASQKRSAAAPSTKPGLDLMDFMKT